MLEPVNYPLMSTEWANAFAQEVARGPDQARVASIEENYWQWIDARKEQINLTFCLAMKSEADSECDAYFVIEQGHIVRTWCDAGESRAEADLVLGGSADDWRELLTGSRNLTQNIMYRKLRLYQGNLHFFFRNIYYFIEMLRQGLRAPTAL